jgi:hypothetical protein
MKSGAYFETYFSERGGFEIKPNGEVDVLCPFLHSKGFEERPSAHVSTKDNVFHCKTCAAEGRFSKGGMSEVKFISLVQNITYHDALHYLGMFDGKSEDEEWIRCVENLQDQPHLLEFLTNQRGLTEETIKEYKLGYFGSGITYPIYVEGFLLDKRTYNPEWKAEDRPKITSEKGTTNLLFPHDQWAKSNDPTLFVAGENDALLARQHGFNAITNTGGEGAGLPKLFAGKFKDKTVYVCYDCDKAGKNGGRRVALQLKEAGATVYLVDLGLAGTPDDKDITDFFLKYNHTSQDLYQKLEEALPYQDDVYQEDKDREYPLVQLWEVPHVEYHNKYISSRVIVEGRYDKTMTDIPTAFDWRCARPNSESKACQLCSKSLNDSGTWFLDNSNLSKLIEIADVPRQQQKDALKSFIGVPKGCPGLEQKILDYTHVDKIAFSPDVESEGEWTDYRPAELVGYTIGMDLQDGERYRIYFKRYPHPTENQQTVMVIDRAETSDSSINAFRMTPEIVKELSIFQGDPFVMMEKRYEHTKEVVGAFSHRMVAYAVDILYHSVLGFKVNGREEKGYPEPLVIGPSRTGKSKTAMLMQRFYGIGNATNLKLASVAGLVGGADRNSKGQFRTKWGIIPKNHKGLLIMDEMSGMKPEMIGQLTAIRSEMVAKIEKISGSGRAPAKTRMIWFANPAPRDGSEKSIASYANGIDIVRELVSMDEDIARFDFIIILPDLELDQIISPFDQEEYEEKDNAAYRHLIYWCWSRTKDQVKFDENVGPYAWQVTKQLNEQYHSTVKLFGTEAFIKLARIAVACAGACFSHDGTGESILVKKEHVDWAAWFLKECYDNEIFQLPKFVEQERVYNYTNPQVNNVVVGLINSQRLLMQQLAKGQNMSIMDLQMLSGLDREQFQGVLQTLIQHSLVRASAGKLQPTQRLAKALKAYRNEYQKQQMIPLGMEGPKL